MNHEYFFTSVVTTEKDENKYLEKVFLDHKCKIQIEKKDSCLSKSAYLHDKLQKKDAGQDSFNSIVCLDIVQKTQMVFNQAGLLINSSDY